MASGSEDLFGKDRDAPVFGAEPGRAAQVLRLNPKTGQRHLDWLTWRLLPHATENPHTAPRPIHARAETVAELGMFAGAFRKRRAIVPASEYAQRATKGEPGRRYAISRRDGQPMAIAGLWESYVMAADDILRTYCILTTEANAAVARTHDRMALVLEERDWAVWLGEVAGDAASLLRPPEGDVLVLRPLAR